MNEVPLYCTCMVLGGRADLYERYSINSLMMRRPPPKTYRPTVFRGARVAPYEQGTSVHEYPSAHLQGYLTYKKTHSPRTLP